MRKYIGYTNNKLVDFICRGCMKMYSFPRKKEDGYEEFLSMFYSLKHTHSLKKALEPNYKSVDSFDVLSKKKSDTIFILGSGESINSITPSEWEVIQKHDSIGFNYFLVNDFVPTYYVLEPSVDKSFFDFFWEIYNDKIEAYKDIPLFIQNNHFSEFGYDLSGMKGNQKNVYFSTPYRYTTSSEKNLKMALKWRKKLGKMNLGSAIHHGGSLIHVLTLAYLMGYKKIVLLGIDLNTSQYFFQKTPFVNHWAEKLSKKCEVYFKEQEDIHQTANEEKTKLYNELPVTKVVKVLNDVYLKPDGIELMTPNTKSLIYSLIDHYEFKL